MEIIMTNKDKRIIREIIIENLIEVVFEDRAEEYIHHLLPMSEEKRKAWLESNWRYKGG